MILQVSWVVCSAISAGLSLARLAHTATASCSVNLVGRREAGWSGIVVSGMNWFFSLEVLTSLQRSSVSMYFHVSSCMYLWQLQRSWRGRGREKLGSKEEGVGRRGKQEEEETRPFKGCAFMKFIIVSWPKKFIWQIQNKCGRALLNYGFREVGKIRGHQSIYHAINLPKYLSLNFTTCEIMYVYVGSEANNFPCYPNEQC